MSSPWKRQIGETLWGMGHVSVIVFLMTTVMVLGFKYVTWLIKAVGI